MPPSDEPQNLASVSRPKQARSEQTLGRLLDAAEALILERGVSDVSVADIARAAGCSVGGFYGRFRDKDELLRALHERSLGELEAVIDRLSTPETWGDAPLPEVVRAGMHAVIREFAGRRRLVAAFLAHAAHNPRKWESAFRFRRRAVARMTALILTRREELAHPDPERAVELAVQTVLAVLDEQALYGGIRAAGGELTDETLADELADLLLAYLRVSPIRARRSSSPPRRASRPPSSRPRR
jgi:AcrR family transcriptional regulator